MLLPAAARRPAPWKNGGGVTTGIAAHPPGSGLDDFVWRVSMAEVAAAGPFSHFAGVDRILCVLDGTLALTIAGDDLTLTPADAPLAFAGDVAVTGGPVAGVVRDLNVMARRGACRALVERLAPGETRVAADAMPPAMIVATAAATATATAMATAAAAAARSGWRRSTPCSSPRRSGSSVPRPASSSASPSAEPPPKKSSRAIVYTNEPG